jgi:hypothetical protein
MSRKKLATAGVKVALAGALAVASFNTIAKRASDCPTVYNPLLGRVPRPGARFHWQIEGDGEGVWTSNCVRRSFLPDGTGKGNLLILGDSFTEAFQVPDEEYFAHILEKRLPTIGLNTPVLAVGKSGKSVADYVAQAGVFRKLFSPAWVIIQVNDSDFCSDAWEVKGDGSARFRYTDQSHTGITLLATAPRDKGVTGWWNDHCPYLSPIVLFAQDRQGVVNAWLKDRDQPWFHAGAGDEAKEKDRQPSLMDYAAGLEMEMLAHAYDKRVTLLYLPRFDPLDPGRETANEAALRRMAEKSGVHFVSLRERFRRLAAAGHAPYGFSNTRFNQGHWNRHGHEAAADLLLEECKRIEHAFH